MINVRRSKERGFADHGWLKSYHTFSFADYYDPAHMNFRALRVINEDWVAAGQGFGTHPHRDMEIITYVLDGAVEHKDSMGNGSIIRPGDVQRMSAGTGVTHSEFNPSATETLHLMQIWIMPERKGLTPSYEQKTFAKEEKAGRLRVVASPDGRDGSVTIHADALLHVGLLAAQQSLTHELDRNRHAWVQVTRGSARVNGQELKQGDGAAISGDAALNLQGVEACELLVFDLA